MKFAIAPLALGLLFALPVILPAASSPAHEPRWCRSQVPQNAAALRERLSVKPVLASYALRPKPVATLPAPKLALHVEPPRVRPQPVPPRWRLAKFEPQWDLVRLYGRLTASCEGRQAGLLCPGYQVVGVEY